jgi:uncharacterized delta-60 repeat protein
MAGDLDTTFDGDGKVTTDFGSNHDQARGVAIQTDGKIVVAGSSINSGHSKSDFALARYNSNGSLDTTFDGDGKVTTAVESTHNYAFSVAIQSDGKIVVAGGNNRDFALTRYNSDGSLDTSFDVDGKVATDFGGSGEYASAVAIESDGKIVVAGYSIGSFALARYNSNGSLDTTFDGDGKVTTAVGGFNDYANSVAIQSDGKIVVAGSSYNGSSHDFALVRYNSNGSLDTTFDGDGKVTTTVGSGDDEAHSVAIQSDGKIVVAGHSWNGINRSFALARYNSNGSLDTTFDGDGKVTTAVGTSDDRAFSVAIQSDGKIVVAGYSLNYSSFDFALVRYNSNGSLDATFDSDGKVTTAVGNSYDYAFSVAIQSDGKIVVAGTNSNSSNDDFALARYHVSEAPTDMTLSNTFIAENAPANTTVGTLSTIDPDAGDTFTYTLVSGTGSIDNAAFNISGNSLRATSNFNFETKSSYTIRIRSTDQGGLFTEKTFSITVIDINESPTNISLSSNTIAENSEASTPVGTLSTADPDAVDTFTYTLVTGTGDKDNAAFNISGSSLRATSSFNFEAKSSYTVRVRSTDQGGLFTDSVFAITVANVNEVPSDIGLSNASIAENSGPNATVGAFSTTDVDFGNTFTYALVGGIGGGDNGAFNISDSTLRATNSLNFEAKSSYSVCVRSTDQGGLFTDKVFLISVTDINEIPSNITLSSTSISENAGDNATVGIFSTIDPDAGNTFSYSLVAGAGGGDNGDFNVVGNSLRATNSFDFEVKPSYAIRVRSTDQGGLFTEETFTITVTNVNEAPTDIALSSSGPLIDFMINGSIESPSVLTETQFFNGQTIGSGWTVISGNTAYVIRNSADLGASPFGTQFLEIHGDTVGQLISGLIPGAAYTLSYYVTLASNSNYFGDGRITASIAGQSDVFDYSLLGNHFFGSAAFPWTKRSLSFTATSSSESLVISGTGAFNQDPFVSIDNVSVIASIPENMGAAAPIGVLESTDPDIGSSLIYSLVAGEDDADNARFIVDGSTLRSIANLDFESQSRYTIRVRATDQGGLFTEESFTIHLTNVNEEPTNINLSATSIPENSEAGAIVGTLSTLDVDVGDKFSYSLVAGMGDLDNNAFTVTGSILRATSSFDFETRSDYTIRIRSTDQGGLFVEKVFAIRVVNANDAPVAVGDSYWVSVDTFQILDILANDLDVDSAIDPTSIEIFSPPSQGTATPLPDGTVRYTPNAGDRGAESFTYRVRDSLGLLSNSATVQLRVNSAPKTTPDSLVVKQAITTVLDVLRNDNDPDGSLDPTSVVIVSGPDMADVVVQSNGTIRFTPRAGFLGTTQFRYVISDNDGRPSVPTEVTVRVVVSIYQNPRNRFDVDDDGPVSPLDVLVLINVLNSTAPSLPVDGLPGPPAYVDVNADNRVDPLDVLAVINHINSRGNGEGEGIAACTFDDVFASDDWQEELRKSIRLRLTRF